MGDKIYGESQDLYIMVHIVAVQMTGFLSAWLIIEFSDIAWRIIVGTEEWKDGTLLRTETNFVKHRHNSNNNISNSRRNAEI